ncbi:MAG: NADH-quinone oxidoreductase subunit L, partial [Candidatus Neomarinimicrobiota bacterium]
KRSQRVETMITGNILTDFGLLILFLPLAAFLILIFAGKKLPREGDWVAIGAVLLTLVLSFGLLLNMFINADPNFKYETSFLWMDLGSFKIEIGFLIDNITIVMLCVVALISSMTHIFSMEYLKGDIRYSRYYAYLGLFTFSMNGIVLANNLISLYIFWELVGLSSYLLIGHWFEKDSAADAGKKAFLTNRVGDIGFFIGIMLIFTALGTFNFSAVFDGIAAGKLGGTVLTFAGIGLFMGAVGKSSQFPLHIWLPDAMEGPTPVSALMHAATMVAAGVYLCVRLFPLFSPEALLFMAYVGGFTALLTSIIAITQNDIKKVLAYSTVSQLGYMIMAVGTGAYLAGFFHLVTHAMFKACLFYGSGSVIHAMHHSLHKIKDHKTDPQDMNNMGGFKSKMPTTYRTMFLATLAISGVPFFSGFLSKDAILAGTLSFALHNPAHFILPVFGFGAALITAFYMFRLMFKTFHGNTRRPEIFKNIQESPLAMTIPLVILASLTLFIFYTLPHLNPFSGSGWFQTLIIPLNSALPGSLNPSALEIQEGLHHAHLPAMIISVLAAGTGIFISWAMYYKNKLSSDVWSQKMGLLYKLSFNKFYFDENYERFLYKPLLKLSEKIAFLDLDLYDKYFINGFGRAARWISVLSGRLDYDGLDQSLVDGIGRSFSAMGKRLRLVQTGHLQNYLLFALAGIIVILILQAV